MHQRNIHVAAAASPRCIRGLAAAASPRFVRGLAARAKSTAEIEIVVRRYEPAPHSLLPGVVMDDAAIARDALPWADDEARARERARLERETLEKEPAPRRVGALAAGAAKELQDAGLATPVGGDFRRRLADASAALVDALQKAHGRTITSLTSDWLFGADGEAYLLCCRGVGVLSVHRPHLGPAPPSAEPPLRYFVDEDAETEATPAALSIPSVKPRRRRAATPPPETPKAVWRGPPGKWPQVKASEARRPRLAFSNDASTPPRRDPPSGRGGAATRPHFFPTLPAAVAPRPALRPRRRRDPSSSVVLLRSLRRRRDPSSGRSAAVAPRPDLGRPRRGGAATRPRPPFGFDAPRRPSSSAGALRQAPR